MTSRDPNGSLERISVLGGLVLLLAAVIVAALISNPSGLRTWKLRILGDQIQTVSEPDAHEIHERWIRREDDEGKRSSVHGAMVQAILTQEARTSGTSPDSIHVRFDEEAEILGILVSVDIGGDMHLVEVAAGIDAVRGYSSRRSADWLIHTSYTSSQYSSVVGGKIDEHVWFGPDAAFGISPSEHLAIGAWLQNGGLEPSGISPEVVIWYRWL